jgi:hypothetical protein
MAKHWTHDEDIFLMKYHGVGVAFISTHDLNRTAAAGLARFKHLTESGTRISYARGMIHMIDADEKSGRNKSEFAAMARAEDRDYWAGEIAALEANQ